MLLISTLRTILTSPGLIPEHYEWDIYSESTNTDEEGLIIQKSLKGKSRTSSNI